MNNLTWLADTLGIWYNWLRTYELFPGLTILRVMIIIFLIGVVLSMVLPRQTEEE